jgi:fumarylacetoacetase
VSWVSSATSSGFDIDNLPYGVIDIDGSATPVVRIGDQALDLRRLTARGLLDVPEDTFQGSTLNRFLALGRPGWTAVREQLTAHLADVSVTADQAAAALVPLANSTPRLPVAIGDYVDYYASRHHAENLGKLFRPDSPPLLPNWRHLPVGYHGRAGTVVVSGTPVRRPCGQRAPEIPGDAPGFGPERRLDFELELGFITGDGPALGTPIAVDDAPDHIFGVVLVNDWTAREIQRWEYQPLGPCLGKSFATSIAPWIVPLDALTAARCAGPTQEPQPTGYLRAEEPWGLDIDLRAALRPDGAGRLTTITRTNSRTLYWTITQQLAHATVAGATIRAGDLFASGTISGEQPGSYGSMIELSWGGSHPIDLQDGQQRGFLLDGDTLTITGHAGRISLGEVTGTVLAAAQ